MPTEIEILGRISTAMIGEAMRDVTLLYAQHVREELANDRPERPKPGSQVYKSERQRRFVMANIKEGKIKVPYVRGRGNGLRGSETMNRKYRVDLDGDTVILTNAAPYAPYVVGDQQAPIHQGRWKTALQAANVIKERGELQKIVNTVMENLNG